MKISVESKKTNRIKGFIISLELVLVSSIVVIGLITGLAAVRSAVVNELNDIAVAADNFDQSFTYDGTVLPSGVGGTMAAVSGSAYSDEADEGAGEVIYVAPRPGVDGSPRNIPENAN